MTVREPWMPYHSLTTYTCAEETVVMTTHTSLLKKWNSSSQGFLQLQLENAPWIIFSFFFIPSIEKRLTNIDLKLIDLPDVPVKMFLFGICRELVFVVCNHNKSHASPCTAKEKNIFIEGKGKLRMGHYSKQWIYRFLLAGKKEKETCLSLLSSVIMKAPFSRLLTL